MRVSSHPNDPGFREDYARFAVYLDNQPCYMVHTADEETGEVHSCDWDTGDTLVYKGAVKIVELEAKK